MTELINKVPGVDPVAQGVEPAKRELGEPAITGVPAELGGTGAKITPPAEPSAQKGQIDLGAGTVTSKMPPAFMTEPIASTETPPQPPAAA